jgi:hypothetical protein
MFSNKFAKIKISSTPRSSISASPFAKNLQQLKPFQPIRRFGAIPLGEVVVEETNAGKYASLATTRAQQFMVLLNYLKSYTYR